MKLQKMKKRRWGDLGWAYLMIAPTILGLLVLNIYPVISTIYLSFTKTGDFGASSFTGIGNYTKMFKDPEVLQATWNTFRYTIGVVPVGVLLALFFAVLLNANIKGKTLFRTIYFLPVVSTPVAVAMVWRWLYNTEFGLLNYLLSLFGAGPVGWLTTSRYAMFSLIVVGIWSTLGYNMVLLLAGLQEIPKTFYEAADIDGASPIRKFFFITLPLVSPTLFFVLVLTFISSLQMFDFIYMMVDRGNVAMGSVQTLVFLFYKYAFQIYDRGYASAIVVFLLAIILAITALQMHLQKKWVHYD
ncbi:carbohydrate ABC transporter permease [Anaerotalea alkaliphila]|uniref:Sugar ABC transporter permease n=1 Tax=Anaerotalea alkaliphila TaxID=2662126 RepID=A0A7X5HTF3_9FIRM|nr:sugar ABC transporter permease [Anaerotalea alkaliphila]NDL66345.1 sugar ABC transporter permease [Anaerotalea alkaliphila]